MTKSFAQKIRPAGSLKDAATRLIDAVGGAPRAENYVRVSKTQLARYTDPGEVDTHMPLDVALVLEKVAGDPVITRYLAAEAGCGLIQPEAGAGDVWRLTAATMRGTGEMIAKLIEAEADGEITPQEAAVGLAEIDKLLGPLMALRAEFQSMREDA